MKRVALFFLTATLFAGLALPQTEVRHAVGLPSYKDLKFPPLPAPRIPTPVEFTLSNGMKVFLLEDHELPDRKGRDAKTRQDEQDRQRRDEYRHRTKLSPPPRSRIWRAVSKRALRRRERRGFALGDLTPRDPADQ